MLGRRLEGISSLIKGIISSQQDLSSLLYGFEKPDIVKFDDGNELSNLMLDINKMSILPKHKAYQIYTSC